MSIKEILIFITFFCISCNHHSELSHDQFQELFKQVFDERSQLSDVTILNEVTVIYPDEIKKIVKFSDMNIEAIQNLVTHHKQVSLKDFTTYKVRVYDGTSLLISRDITMDCGEESCAVIEHYYFKKIDDQWKLEMWSKIAET